MTDIKHIAAAQKMVALGYNWIGDEWVKTEPPKRYGCHCDLDPDAEPDGCVLDDGRPGDCRIAARLLAEGKVRDDCPEWRPVVFTHAQQEQQTAQ